MENDELFSESLCTLDFVVSLMVPEKVSGFNKTFNKIAIQGATQMAVDKEAISLSRVYSY